MKITFIAPLWNSSMSLQVLNRLILPIILTNKIYKLYYQLGRDDKQGKGDIGSMTNRTW